MLGLGWWVGKQIETGVVNQTGAEKALYVNSFIHPILETYTPGEKLSPQAIAYLDSLVQNSPLGKNIVSLKIWDLAGHVIYSTSPDMIGGEYSVNPNLEKAMSGNVVATISDLAKPEDDFERNTWEKLLETYSPITKSSTSQITAVAEFYQTMDALQDEINNAQRSSWLLLGISFLVIYLIQAIFVQRASDTIRRQGLELNDKVFRLTDLLTQNTELHERVKRASSRSATMNEHVLRRISAELHDGPAQDLGYTILRLDGIRALIAGCPDNQTNGGDGISRLKEIEDSLQHAMVEIRAISSGMGLPELDGLAFDQTLERVITSHERRTGTKVNFSFEGRAQSTSLSTKIISYRLVQEALNNSFRHAGGKGQEVRATMNDNELFIEVSDQGPGFDVNEKINQESSYGAIGYERSYRQYWRSYRNKKQSRRWNDHSGFYPLNDRRQRKWVKLLRS